MLYGFCSKFRVLSRGAKFLKSVKIGQSYRQLKGGNFFSRHSVVIITHSENKNTHEVPFQRTLYKFRTISYLKTQYCKEITLTPHTQMTANELPQLQRPFRQVCSRS